MQEPYYYNSHHHIYNLQYFIPSAIGIKYWGFVACLFMYFYS